MVLIAWRLVVLFELLLLVTGNMGVGFFFTWERRRKSVGSNILWPDVFF